MDDSPRIWGGTTLEERKRERRVRLLQAGVTLIAAGGGQAVSVRAVCREAGLTSRYFYEHFEGRDDFTVEVFRSVAEECQTAIEAAVSRASRDHGSVAAAAVDAVVGVAVDHPDKGRVLFVAPTTDPVLFDARDRFFPVIAEMIADQIPQRDSLASRRLKSASLVGALGHTFFLYVGGHLDVPRKVFVQHCVDLLLTVGAMRGANRR
jgi:AcrR family transcriptional regulator